MRLALYGFGHVGRALARLLVARRDDLPFTVTAIVTARHGALVAADGIDLGEALARERFADASPAVADLPADVLVEMTTLDARTGEPGLTHIRAALAAGLHVVTANKGPLAVAFRELGELARARGRMLRYEATLADCLPVFNLARAALPLANVRAMRGIVSSTCNYVLSEAARGATLAAALAEARRLGIAEADPTNDLEGHDAAAKAAILANGLMAANLRASDVRREPIDERSVAAARAAAALGERVRPLVTIVRSDGAVSASFGPRRLRADDPLYAVDGFSMALELETDLAGSVVVQLHDPGVEQTAYAILTDLLEIATARGAGRRLGAAAVIPDGAGRVLLVRHTYGELNWNIPGGSSEPGESAADTALREVREETGAAIALERFGGVYFEPEADMHHFVFTATLAPGSPAPAPSSDEISEVRWCDPADPPRPISDFTLRRIEEALRGEAPAVGTIGRRVWLR
jgi:homoserine dehydrogenase